MTPQQQKIINLILSSPDQGVKMGLQDLRKVRYTIAFMPRSRQADYADQVARRMINDYSFQAEQLARYVDLNDYEAFSHFNATSVGNLALLATQSPHPIIRQKVDTLLVNYKFFVSEIINRMK